jgi:hypothetical protein
MMTALILVCSITTVSNMGDCTRDNALDIMYVPPTLGSPVSCLMHAQAYLADSSIGRDLQQNEGVKVMCVRGNRIDKAERAVQAAGRANLYCASADGSPLSSPIVKRSPRHPGCASEVNLASINSSPR